MVEIALRKVLDIGRKEIVVSPVACGVIGVFGFIILTAAGAFVRIPLPFTPVPLTLQTFFVLLAGAVLGRKLGLLSQAGYVILGMLGLPIFAGAAGGAL
ncbi:MAG: biotin transporter BioY, partial [Candidatus Saganbacteria bacterium]|nr:biotin transporter BioY [Candidatus Saganbacteria bacterium]